MFFKIKNSLNDTEKKSHGIGLENTKKRLEILYPKRHQLEIKQTENEFQVVLVLK